MVIDRFVKKVI